jgi:hypothetical protein
MGAKLTGHRGLAIGDDVGRSFTRDNGLRGHCRPRWLLLAATAMAGEFLRRPSPQATNTVQRDICTRFHA